MQLRGTVGDMATTEGVFETFFDSCVRGYVYQEKWNPVLGETPPCTRELGNTHNIFAVKVTKAGATIGHVPKKISLTCSLFIQMVD